MQQQQQQSELIFQDISYDDDENLNACHIDFGCNKNLRWRTCNSDANAHE